MSQNAQSWKSTDPHDSFDGSFGETTGQELDKELADQKYKRRPWSSEVPGIRVYKRKSGLTVVIPTIQIAPPKGGSIAKGSQRASVPSPADEFFYSLREELEILRKQLGPVTDIFLPGGGTIPIPTEFETWLKNKGIRLHVIAIEEADSIKKIIRDMAKMDEKLFEAKKELAKGSKRAGFKVDI